MLRKRLPNQPFNKYKHTNPQSGCYMLFDEDNGYRKIKTPHQIQGDFFVSSDDVVRPFASQRALQDPRGRPSGFDQSETIG